MKSNHDAILERIINSEFNVIDLPPFYMEGECGRYFKHQDPEIEALRNAVPIYYGDWDIHIRILKRDEFENIDFLQFVANSIRLILEREENQSNKSTFILKDLLILMPKLYGFDSDQRIFDESAAPCHYLWDITNFGTLLWDWIQISRKIVPESEKNRLYGVYGKSPNGEEFLPRIFLNVEPEATSETIKNLLPIAFEELNNLPDLLYGIDRNQLKEIILSDMNHIKRICNRHGNFGNSAILGAFDPVKKAFFMTYNGNVKRVFLETTDYYYFFYLTTS